MVSWERPGDAGELASLLSDLPAGTTVLPTGSPPPGADASPHEAIVGADDPGPGEESEPPLVVSTASLSGVRELTPEELIVTVGSGTRLDALRDELAGAGTWLAVGPEAEARSAGGAVAAASPGPWDAAYGDLPRQVLACRVVTRAGTLARWGRGVMKNVAGYDLRRLLCGSWGRLGVLTEVTFRLWPAAPAAIRCRLTADEGALELAGRLIEEGADAGFRPDAVRWSLPPGPAGELVVRFRGAEGSVGARAQALEAWAGGAGADVERLAEDDDPGGDALRESGDRSPARSVVAVRPGRRAFVATARRLCDALGSDLEALEGHPLQGTLRCAYRNGVGGASADEARPDDGATGDAEAGRRLNPDAPLSRVLGTARAPVSVVRGRAAELAAVRERRDPGVVDAEERVVSALEGQPRHWLSGYL